MNTRLRSSLEDIIASARTPDAAPTTSSTIPQRFMPEAESLGNRHGWTRPLLAAAAAIVVIGGVSALNRRSNVVTVGSGPTAGPVTSTAPVDPSVGGATATTVASVSTTVPKTTLSRTLSKGLPASEDVRVMQQRLNDLHFDVGAVDGIFGVNTEMAVWAYQSLILNLSGKSITGKVTPELWDRMQDPLGLPMFRPDASSTHAEILLPAQAMALYVNHELRLITHVSSGSGQKWCDELKNQASHGCVRVPMHISMYLPDLLHNRDQIFVWDGVKEPEAYGDQKPPVDERDPTDTTVVTTTVAPTTIAPTTTTTTMKPTATTIKPTTTAATPSATSAPTLPTPSSSVASVASTAATTAPATPST